MFQDQQYMELVSHVSSCPYMNQGLYDCPYCNKEERFCWDVSYYHKEGDLTGANPMSGPYEGPMASTGPQIAVSGPTFSGNYPENGNKPFPEDFLNDPRASRSPNPGHVDLGKRKYDQIYEPAYSQGPSNEPMSVTNGEYTQSQDRLPQHEYMVDLPSPNTAGHGSTHLSPQPSPEILSRNTPSMGQTMQIGMGNFGLVDRNSTQIMAPFDPSQVPLTMGSIMGTQVPTLRASQAGNSQTVSPIARERAMSNPRIVHSQSSPRQRSSSGHIGDSMNSQDTRAGNASRAVVSESSSGGAAEAEKGSVTCKQCGKVLRGKVAWLPSNLQRHMREIHLSAPRTECRVCGRTFNRGHNLRHHMKAVHGEQP